MGTIRIDGKVFTGNHITIRNGKVTIDGKPQDGELQGVVEIKVIEGVLGTLETDASVTCNDVRGNVQAGGSVTCNNVGGTIQAGGSVSAAGNAKGTIMAGGSIRVG